MQPAYQLQLLDAFGDIDKLRMSYLDLAEVVRALRKRYHTRLVAQEQRRRELALLRFERDELDQANLQPNEQLELAGRERLANAQSLQAFTMSAYNGLYEGDDSLADRLGKLQRKTEQWAPFDVILEKLVGRLHGLQTEIQDIAEVLRELGQRFEADPQRLEEVEYRLQFIRRLEAKYRRTVDELIVYRIGLDEQEQRLQQEEDDLGNIEAELRTAFERLRRAATDLSKQRQRVAKRLAIDAEQLADLGMAGARLDAAAGAGSLGDDPFDSEMPAWGPGSWKSCWPPTPASRPALRKVASGGELSRTMLALKTVLAGHDQRVTLRLRRNRRQRRRPARRRAGPEARGTGSDASGHLRHASAAGGQLRSTSLDHPQNVSPTAPSRSITPLQDAERLEELASMLRGEARGETTRKEAAAMLDAARKKW